MSIDKEISDILIELDVTDLQYESTLTSLNKMTWTQKVDYKRKLKEQKDVQSDN